MWISPFIWVSFHLLQMSLVNFIPTYVMVLMQFQLTLLFKNFSFHLLLPVCTTTIGFCVVTLESLILLKSLTALRRFLMYYFGHSLFTIMPLANKDSFTFSFPICMFSFFFCAFLCLLGLPGHYWRETMGSSVTHRRRWY